MMLESYNTASINIIQDVLRKVCSDGFTRLLLRKRLENNATNENKIR